MGEDFLGLSGYGYMPGWQQEPQVLVDSGGGGNFWGVLNDVTDLFGQGVAEYYATERARYAAEDQTPVNPVQQPVGQNAAIQAGMMQDSGTLKMIGFALVGVAVVSIMTSGKRGK